MINDKEYTIKKDADNEVDEIYNRFLNKLNIIHGKKTINRHKLIVFLVCK
jgi:hypothetical protein